MVVNIAELNSTDALRNIESRNEEVPAAGAYEEFRDDLKQELEKQVEGFVRIGYKLKQARDTRILEESGYRDYKEFAWEEYKLSESVVSRYISINDRYSVGGNSEELRQEYQGYGYTKLAEMLAIPDAIAENLDPSLSKMDIRQIAGEVKEERKITDLEVLMEGQREDQKELSLIQKVMHQYFRDHRESFVGLFPVIGRRGQEKADPDVAMDILAPAGTAVIFVRVQGIGKMMLHLTGTEQNIRIQNTRTMETILCDWSQFLDEIKGIFDGCDLTVPEQAWEKVYQEPYRNTEEKPEEPESVRKKPVSKVKGTPEKKKIAPAQKETSKPEQKPKEKKLEIIEQVAVEKPKNEEIQIPGQDTILNHPEYLPEDYQTDAQVDGEPVLAAVDPTVTQRKEECLSLISTIQENMTLERYEEAYQAVVELLRKLEVMKC